MVPNPIELRAGHAKAGRRCPPLPAPSPIELRMGHANTLTPASRSAARDLQRRAQGEPFIACPLSPHTDTGAPSVRLPVPIEPLADNLGILTPVPLGPLADDRGILIPAPLRPSYRCSLDPHAGTPSTPIPTK